MWIVPYIAFYNYTAQIHVCEALVIHQDYTVCNHMYTNVYMSIRLYQKASSNIYFPIDRSNCIYLLSRNKEVFKILGGVVVVLHVCDLDATLNLKLKQM